MVFFYHFVLRYDLVAKKSSIESSKTAEAEKIKSTTESEFISDKFKATNEKDLVEVQANMTKLGLTGKQETKVDEKKASSAGKRMT